MSPPDAELVARVVLRDDRHAFAELVRRHQSPVRLLLVRLTGGDRALADDLAQEVFLKAYRGLASYKGTGKLLSWLFSLATNLFLTEAQKTKRRKTEPTADVPELEPSRPLETLLGRGLERALLDLPLAERAALLLVAVHGLTYEEAAEALDSPTGTVKTHVHRAKARLREVLNATGS